MKNTIAPILALSATLLSPLALPQQAAAHCQVPCGIYGDERVFSQLEEHATTVTKAAAQITELAGKTDAQSAQQLARWTANKESHAQEIQQIALDYFLAQRIKLPGENATDDEKLTYAMKLHYVHSIIVHSMKVKQNADPSHGEKLTAAIATFKTAYNTK